MLGSSRLIPNVSNTELSLLMEEFGRRWFRTSEVHHLDLAMDFVQRAYEVGLTEQSGWDFGIQAGPDDRGPDGADGSE
jgi:hypothetical protein